MKVKAAVCMGLEQPWSIEQIDLDGPHAHEVAVDMAYAGMCQSDEHLRSGDLEASDETLEMLGVPSLFPVIGGHEGAGVVAEVGEHVEAFAPGDKVAMSFIPSCGTCHCYPSGTAGALPPPPDDLEEDTLGHVLDRRPESRLACQIRLDANLDGLAITLPRTQPGI